MKKLSMFLSGVVTTLLLGSICITAIAASESWTITVNPINIQVNGETFQPTNLQGNPVPVFAYNGTTYAPVRALAEAYGLEVGYDPETNMATVNDPDIVGNTIQDEAKIITLSSLTINEKEYSQKIQEDRDVLSSFAVVNNELYCDTFSFYYIFDECEILGGTQFDPNKNGYVFDASIVCKKTGKSLDVYMSDTETINCTFINGYVVFPIKQLASHLGIEMNVYFDGNSAIITY